jgi:hypothetical protein
MADLYLCKLVHNSDVQQSFYRRGDSASEIIKALHLFEWAPGTWRVSKVNEGDRK